VKADVVIIGAGPTGCALGAYLARRGAQVRLVDAVPSPAGVVGESMLPCSGLIFDELGFDLSGFAVKHGAVFCQGGQAVRFDFSEAESPRWPHAYQVQREVFDARWRELAAAAGCQLTWARAERISLPGVLHTDAGDLRGGLIVDAGGRGMWMSRQLGLRVGDPRLRNAAVGTRCSGVRQLPPDQEGDITICCIDGGWIWIIPFGGGVASVGVVTTPASPFNGLTVEERFARAIASSPDATARLSGATRLFPFRGLQDFTATSTAFSGPGFALCGDAATFIDPVFSSGVLLGLHGARQLAAALDGGDLAAWEAEYREGAGVFRKVIDHWYDGDFMAVALCPPELQRPAYRQGIVSLLAGDVYDPARRSPRVMAERMPVLAKAVRAFREDAPGA
jgi:flavin-dependent dehydrogenase